MGTRIELANNTEEGRVTADAVYEDNNRSPTYVVIEDHRPEDPVRMRLEYDRRDNKLGLTSVSGSETADINELIDNEVFIILDELYDGSVELERWRSFDQFVRYTRDGIGRFTESVESVIRSKSEDLF